MHTSLRHYSLTVERDAQAGRTIPVHRDTRPESRRSDARTPSLRDRIHATLRPARRLARA
jgi:hypothetical protein